MSPSGRRRLLATVVSLLVTTGAAAQTADGPPTPPRQDPDQLFARAVDLHQAGDLLGAIEAYEAVLNHAPDRIDARSNLGAALVHLGRFQEGIEQYRLALEGDPRHLGIRFNLGLALYKASRTPEAAGELAQVVEREPDNAGALLVLAECYLQMGRDGRVIELLSPRQAQLGGDRAFAYLLGTALIREGELERGQVLIDRIFRDGSAEGHLLIGAALLSEERFPEAVTELASAVELDPELPTVHSLYGRALLASGDQPAAARAFLRELERNPNDFEANLYLGNLRRHEQRFEEALAYLRRAQEMRGDDATILQTLGSVYLATGRMDEAREVLEQAIAAAPDFVAAHVLLSTVYYRLKRQEDGDRHRAIVERLNAEAQAREPGARQAAEPYRGEDLPPPRPPQ